MQDPWRLEEVPVEVHDRGVRGEGQAHQGPIRLPLVLDRSLFPHRRVDTCRLDQWLDVEIEAGVLVGAVTTHRPDDVGGVPRGDLGGQCLVGDVVLHDLDDELDLVLGCVELVYDGPLGGFLLRLATGTETYEPSDGNLLPGSASGFRSALRCVCGALRRVRTAAGGGLG
jgi:hypothetical protein